MVKVDIINGGGGSASPAPISSAFPPSHYLSGLTGSTARPRPKPITTYSSPSRVIQAFRNMVLDYNEAVEALMVQFGYSNTDADEALIEEGVAPTTADDAPKPEVLPPVEDRGEVVVEDETIDTGSVKPMLEGEYAFIGLIALAGLAWLLFSKEGAAKSGS